MLLRYAGESLFAYEGFYWGRLLGHKQFVSTNELEADRRGAIISGDPAGLASALRKVEASQAQERITWRERMEAGYPSFEGRIERLEKMAQEMPQVSESAPQHLHHAPPVHGRESEPKRQVSGITSTHRVTALDAPEIAAS